jgi:hypothetical protein
MKLLWLFVFILFSCKVVTAHDFPFNDNKPESHFVEITFVNAGVNFSSVLGVIQKNGFHPQLRYTSTNIYQPLISLCFTCYSIKEESLDHLKSAIGLCNGVVAINDTMF